jgi:hypothetical protein
VSEALPSVLHLSTPEGGRICQIQTGNANGKQSFDRFQLHDSVSFSRVADTSHSTERDCRKPRAGCLHRQAKKLQKDVFV